MSPKYTLRNNWKGHRSSQTCCEQNSSNDLLFNIYNVHKNFLFIDKNQRIKYTDNNLIYCESNTK